MKLTMMARSRPGAAKLVGGIFAVLGFVFLCIAAWTGNRQYTILESWPTAEAEVLKSEVTSGRDSEGTPMYGTEITFRYAVDGQTYATPAASGYRSSTYGEMKNKVDAYSPGSHHPIRFNPTDPVDIRFDVGFNLGFFLLPAIFGLMGVVFFAIGVGLRVASRGAEIRRCSSCSHPLEPDDRFCPQCGVALPIQ